MNARSAVIAAFSAALVLQGCATASKDLTASYVSPLQYQSFDCDQLRAEAQRIQTRVVQLGGRLDEAANNDKGIMAVGLIIFWPALFALGGTKAQEAEYSRLKGEYDAIEEQAIMKKCSGITPSATMAGAPSTPKDAAVAPPVAAVAATEVSVPLQSTATATAAPPAAQPTPAAAPVPVVAAPAAPIASAPATPSPAATPRTPLAPAATASEALINRPAPASAPPLQPVGLKQPSRHQFSAERFAKENGCVLPAAVMTIKQFESETFTVNCADGNALIVRCEGSVCRTLQ